MYQSLPLPAATSRSTTAGHFSLHPSSIKHKYLQNLPRALRIEVNNTGIPENDLRLPPIEDCVLSPSLKLRGEPVLPRLQSLVYPGDLPKEAGMIYPCGEGSVEDCGQSHSPGSPMGTPMAAPIHSFSEKQGVEEKPLSAASPCFSLKFPGSSYTHTDDEWSAFSTEELRYNCLRVSPNRPRYNLNAQSSEPKRRAKKAPGAKTESKLLSSEKHAGAERNRRDSHKTRLIRYYKKANDYALEAAGWPHKSVKPPTKEIILQAFEIHQQMFERLWWLTEQQLYQQVRADRPGGNQNGIFNGICDQCHKHWYSIQTRPIIPSSPNGLPFRGTVQHSSFFNRTLGSSNPEFSTGKTWAPRSDPVHSTPSPSSPASSQSFCLNPTKRKREEVEDEDEITPTGPLRNAVAKNSPSSSPHSPTSSRGSWCWVEKQA